MSKAILPIVGLIVLSLLTVHITAQNDCVASQNTYWTGYRCACKVGYKNDTNVCIPLTLLKTKGWVVREPTIIGDDSDQFNSTTLPVETPVANVNCYLPYEYFNGQGCVCLDGYARVNGLCQKSANTPSTNVTVTCQANSVAVNGVCVCNSGYTLTNGACVATSSGSSCGANSIDNGLGFCVCNSGFYKLNNNCVAGSACPPSSTRNAQGECICDAGLNKYGDYCAKCPLGAIFDTATSKCVFVCGANSNYDASKLKCQCQTGYGIYDKSCLKCPTDFFVLNNYCVTCPVGSGYNAVSNKCECSAGFQLGKDGICVRKCANNQVYNSQLGSCVCLTGLGRVNNVCGICPTGTSPNTNGTCAACGINQKLVDGACICNAGFIPNGNSICTQCNQVTGAFLVNGNCALCPGDLTYDGSKCSCAAGFTRVGSRCKQTCKTDELVDDNGVCYKCPIYEIISADRKCVCQTNYARNSSTSKCQLTCPAGQFKYQGRCAQCPLNLQYRPEISGCACPDGQYLNTYGVCEKVVLAPVTCDAGFYFDSSKGCVACSNGCKTCSSANVCLSCTQNGFSVANGVCQASCGDGLIASSEQCDDSNKNSNDGCSATCQVEALWSCTGVPSVCTYNGPAVCGNGRIEKGEECDDGNLANGDGCSNKCLKESNNNNNNNSGNQTAQGLTLVGDINTNINNVFVVLKTSKVFTFANENEMQSFIKTKFPDSTTSPQVYCSQRDNKAELDTFDCLTIYSSGIPNQKFKIQFSYNYQGESGFISVSVDPLATSFATRARRSG